MLKLRLNMDFAPTENLTVAGLDWYSLSRLNQNGRKYKKRTNLCKSVVILSYLQFLGVNHEGFGKNNRPRATKVSRVKCLV